MSKLCENVIVNPTKTPYITIKYRNGGEERRDLVVLTKEHRQFNHRTKELETVVVLATSRAKFDDVKAKFHDEPSEDGLPRQKETGEIPTVLEFAVSLSEYEDLCVGVVSLLLKELDEPNKWAFGSVFHKPHSILS